MSMSPTELSPPLLKRIAEEAISARAVAHASLSDDAHAALRQKAIDLLRSRNAVLVAHYYVDSELQELAEETLGCVADSLEMARFGFAHTAQTIVVAGVRFMGETAKILSPEKRVLVVDSAAECSLDLGCPAETFFSILRSASGSHSVVVYANTSAEVKARADWVVTSSIALDLIRDLSDRGEKIIWAPDRYLGDSVRRETGADILLWRVELYRS